MYNPFNFLICCFLIVSSSLNKSSYSFFKALSSILLYVSFNSLSNVFKCVFIFSIAKSLLSKANFVVVVLIIKKILFVDFDEEEESDDEGSEEDDEDLEDYDDDEDYVYESEEEDKLEYNYDFLVKTHFQHAIRAN